MLLNYYFFFFKKEKRKMVVEGVPVIQRMELRKRLVGVAGDAHPKCQCFVNEASREVRQSPNLEQRERIASGNWGKYDMMEHATIA
jgi:hypothetical protein